MAVGDYDDIHIAALLTHIRTRGETFADIAGAAKAFLKVGYPFPITGEGLMDSAGTGGDGTNTINITTGASSLPPPGSEDDQAWQPLGLFQVRIGRCSRSTEYPTGPDAARAVRQFKASNFTFLFAPAYNPAVAHVQPVRKALGIPTIFNTLGPLLSPGRPSLQIMGIANPAQGQLIAEVFRELGRERALVVHGAGTDEIATHGTTQAWELNNGEIVSYELTPEDLGIKRHELADLAGGDGAANAQALRAVLPAVASPPIVTPLPPPPAPCFTSTGPRRLSRRESLTQRN